MPRDKHKLQSRDYVISECITVLRMLHDGEGYHALEPDVGKGITKAIKRLERLREEGE